MGELRRGVVLDHRNPGGLLQKPRRCLRQRIHAFQVQKSEIAFPKFVHGLPNNIARRPPTYQQGTAILFAKQFGVRRVILDKIELREIGDVRGKTLLHLQCHIGTDSLAWARRGAIVTGLDFSSESIACAEQLKQELGLEATFVHANVYDARLAIDEQFDTVYTSKGVLCWLRDLEEWGRIVAGFLKPGGTFYLMETHPILSSVEEESPGELSFKYNYFHRAEPTIWDDDDPDYADADYVPENASYEWTWTVGDIVNALLKAGLQLELLNEYEKLFFKLYPSMTTDDGRWYRLPKFSGKLPLLLTLRARKPA